MLLRFSRVNISSPLFPHPVFRLSVVVACRLWWESWNVSCMSLPYRNKMSRNGRNRKVSEFAASFRCLALSHSQAPRGSTEEVQSRRQIFTSRAPNCDEQQCTKQHLGCTDAIFGDGVVSDRGAVPLRGYIGHASLMARA